jgi:hypothetical protein
MLVRWIAQSREARYRLGHPLADRYLELVAAARLLNGSACQALRPGRFVGHSMGLG